MKPTPAPSKMKIAIMGATGNVGRKIVDLLLHRTKVLPENLTLYASERSAGKEITIGEHRFTIQDTKTCDFQKHGLVLFATDSDISKKYVPEALSRGCYVVDSSSAYRLDSRVPLIIEPVNGNLVKKEQKMYAVPNCLAAPISVVSKPLHDLFKITRLIASTYQSTSGAGRDPMEELFEQSQVVLNGEKATTKHFARPIAFNVIPQVDKIQDDGFTNEERKIIKEVQKILSDEIKVLATSVRVPVGIGHSISLSLQFERPFTLEQVKDVLAQSQGVVVSQNSYETPIEIVGSDFVHVGRIRKDPTIEHGLALWLSSDNLRRGAALDAVEVAERLLGL